MLYYRKYGICVTCKQEVSKLQRSTNKEEFSINKANLNRRIPVEAVESIREKLLSICREVELNIESNNSNLENMICPVCDTLVVSPDRVCLECGYKFKIEVVHNVLK